MSSKPKTPIEKYILKQFALKRKSGKAMIDLEKFGKKLPSGGHVWTGRDLIRYFEAQKRRGLKIKKPKKGMHAKKEHKRKKTWIQKAMETEVIHPQESTSWFDWASKTKLRKKRKR